MTRIRAKSGEKQAEYKHLVASFLRLYSFLSQIMPFADAELEKFYAYGCLLTTKLRDDSIALSLNGEGALPVPSKVGTGEDPHEDAPLSTIVNDLNKRFGTDFTTGDQLFFEQIEEDLIRDRDLSKQAKTNSIDNFKYPFDDVFIGKVIERREQNQEITDKIMNEDQFSDAVRDFLVKRVYSRLQKSE